MDYSSLDESGADTENDEEEHIPVAVPVAAVVASRSHEDIESDDEIDEPAGADAGLDTTLNTVDGDDETHSVGTDVTPGDLTPPPSASSKKRSNSEATDQPSCMSESAKKRKYNDGRPRQPAAKGLTIPFRTIKRIMKIDSDIGIVQNDAAIVATAALEHFVKTFAVKSLELAKSKGRNTIKYDDVAEVRASDRSLSFLDLLLP